MILLLPLLAVISRTLAFPPPGRDPRAQGIAYDSATRSFFMGSVVRRKILRRAPDGAVTEFVRSGQEGILGVAALGVNGRRRLLWALTAAVPEMDGWAPGDLGLMAVFAYDLDSGRLARKIYPTLGHGDHEPGGLAVAPGGEVYFADSVGSGVYRIAADGEEAEVFVAPGLFQVPRGLAVSPDGRTLYVADEVQGLWGIDLATRKRDPLRGSRGAVLRGIVGLAPDGPRLIALRRSSSGGFSIVSLNLSDGGRRVRTARRVARDGKTPPGPSQGVVVDGDLCLVGPETAVVRVPLLP